MEKWVKIMGMIIPGVILWFNPYQGEGPLAEKYYNTSQQSVNEMNGVNTEIQKHIIPEEAEKGRALFTGRIRLSAGGPPCITCHHVTDDEGTGGAFIAPDLTNVYSRIDEKAIIYQIISPVTESMKIAFENNLVRPEEAGLIAAYLKYIGTQTRYQMEQNRRAENLLNRFKKAEK